MRVVYVENSMLNIFEDLIADSALDKIKEEENTITLGLVSDDDKAVGALSGFLFEDTFYITSIFVDPDYRNNGGGRLLMDTLMESMTDEEIIICVEFMTEDVYKDGLANFFECIEFTADDDGFGAYSANANDIAKDPIFTDAKYDKLEENISSFSKIDTAILESLNEFAINNFLPLPQDGLFSESVDKDISVAHINGAGVIDAYLVVDNSIEYMPTVAGIYNDTDARVLSGMLRHAMRLCHLKYPMGVEIAFAPVNGDSMSIMQKLAPDATKLSYKYYTFPEKSE